MDAVAPRASRDVALAALRRYRPASVVAKLADGAERTVALGKGRGRWERAAGVVSPWVDDGGQIELRNAAGAVIAVIEADREEAGADVAGDVHAREERLLALLVRAQDMALRHHREMVSGVMQAHASMVSSLAGRLSQLERGWGTVLKAQYEAVRASAERTDDEDGLEGLAAMAIGKAMGVPMPGLPQIAGVQGAASPPAGAAAKEGAPAANGPRGPKRKS